MTLFVPNISNSSSNEIISLKWICDNELRNDIFWREKTWCKRFGPIGFCSSHFFTMTNAGNNKISLQLCFYYFDFHIYFNYYIRLFIAPSVVLMHTQREQKLQQHFRMLDKPTCSYLNNNTQCFLLASRQIVKIQPKPPWTHLMFTLNSNWTHKTVIAMWS